MVLKISASVAGVVIGWMIFGPSGAFSRRWQVLDSWSLRPVEDFHTRRGAQDLASQLNEEMMYEGWKARYSTVHKSVTKEWR